MKIPLLALCLAVLPLGAWGDKGHRAVSVLALRSLPKEPGDWFRGHEAEVADHASDPDHWKQDRKEGPRHFLDVEPYGGPDRVPTTQEEAQAMLGGDYARLGVLPWIIQDRWRDLVAAFKEGDPAKVALATAILGHYVGDAHVPLHTTLNHDGQLTDQRGIHSRWENGLVERYVSMESLSVPVAQPDPSFLKRPWEWLRATHSLVPQLLADDREADRTTPQNSRGLQRGQAYWAILSDKQGPVVKRQLQFAGQRLGEAVLSAWIAAGKPAAPK